MSEVVAITIDQQATEALITDQDQLVQEGPVIFAEADLTDAQRDRRDTLLFFEKQRIAAERMRMLRSLL